MALCENNLHFEKKTTFVQGLNYVIDIPAEDVKVNEESERQGN